MYITKIEKKLKKVQHKFVKHKFVNQYNILLIEMMMLLVLSLLLIDTVVANHCSYVLDTLTASTFGMLQCNYKLAIIP